MYLNKCNVFLLLISKFKKSYIQYIIPQLLQSAGGAVINAVTSPWEGPVFKPGAGALLSLHARPARVSSGCSGFLSQSKDKQIRLIDDSKLAVGVNVSMNGCLSLCHPCDWLAASPLAQYQQWSVPAPLWPSKGYQFPTRLRNLIWSSLHIKQPHMESRLFSFLYRPLCCAVVLLCPYSNFVSLVGIIKPPPHQELTLNQALKGKKALLKKLHWQRRVAWAQELRKVRQVEMRHLRLRPTQMAGSTFCQATVFVLVSQTLCNVCGQRITTNTVVSLNEWGGCIFWC